MGDDYIRNISLIFTSKINRNILLSTEWVDYVEKPMKYQALRPHFFSIGMVWGGSMGNGVGGGGVGGGWVGGMVDCQVGYVWEGWGGQFGWGSGCQGGGVRGGWVGGGAGGCGLRGVLVRDVVGGGGRLGGGMGDRSVE